jgi:hypothetical protein
VIRDPSLEKLSEEEAYQKTTAQEHASCFTSPPNEASYTETELSSYWKKAIQQANKAQQLWSSAQELGSMGSLWLGVPLQEPENPLAFESESGIPDLVSIIGGHGGTLNFPTEPMLQYATTIKLALQVKTADEATEAMRWLVNKARIEWVQLFGGAVMPRLRELNQQGVFALKVQADPQLKQALQDYQKLLGLSPFPSPP